MIIVEVGIDATGGDLHIKAEMDIHGFRSRVDHHQLPAESSSYGQQSEGDNNAAANHFVITNF